MCVCISLINKGYICIHKHMYTYTHTYIYIYIAHTQRQACHIYCPVHFFRHVLFYPHPKSFIAPLTAHLVHSPIQAANLGNMDISSFLLIFGLVLDEETSNKGLAMLNPGSGTVLQPMMNWSPDFVACMCVCVHVCMCVHMKNCCPGLVDLE